jgi:hypothetical protein
MRLDAPMQRLAGIVVLAALIVAAATLFGNEFAPEAMHEEEAAAEAEHAEADEAKEEEEREETGAGQVASAVLISIGGVALVPLTAPLARRRKPEDDVGGDVAAGAEPALARRLRVGLALLSIGAAVIHFAVIPQHMREWWLTGTFFLVVALFQLAWAVAVLARPSQPLYLIGAIVNALVVITWIVSRTVGVPVGPEAGEPESIGLADVLATSYEVLLVAGGLALALQMRPARRLLGPLASATGTWVTAVAVVALTALTLALLP